MDWGTVPSWIQTFATVAAFAIAFRLFRLQSSTLQASLKEVARTQQFAPAQICLWKTIDTTRDRPSLTVLNASPLPIVNVEVSYVDPAGTRIVCEFSDLFPPGLSEDVDLTVEPATAALLAVEMSFTDVYGEQWRRTPSSVERMSQGDRSIPPTSTSRWA